MFPKLPGDVVIAILEYLSLSDLAHVALASRDMYHLVSGAFEEIHSLIAFVGGRIWVEELSQTQSEIVLQFYPEFSYLECTRPGQVSISPTHCIRSIHPQYFFTAGYVL